MKLTQRQLSRLGQVTALTVALALAGCGEDARQSIAKCTVEAFRLYPSKKGDDVEVARYVRNCMEAKGYRFDLSKEECRYLSSTSSVGCYEDRPF
jgi:hypothetical protein